MLIEDIGIEILHFDPIDDLFPHDIRGCWCEPAVEYERGWILVIHNAADAREWVEKGYKVITILVDF